MRAVSCQVGSCSFFSIRPKGTTTTRREDMPVRAGSLWQPEGWCIMVVALGSWVAVLVAGRWFLGRVRISSDEGMLVWGPRVVAWVPRSEVSVRVQAVVL
jgi:hypothetical protein